MSGDGASNHGEDQGSGVVSEEPTLREGYLRFNDVQSSALPPISRPAARAAVDSPLRAAAPLTDSPTIAELDLPDTPSAVASNLRGDPHRRPPASIPGGGHGAVLRPQIEPQVAVIAPRISQAPPPPTAPWDDTPAERPHPPQRLVVTVPDSAQRPPSAASVATPRAQPLDDATRPELNFKDRIVRRVPKPPVRHSAEQSGHSRLEGASLGDQVASAAMQDGVRQMSSTVLRLRVGHRVPGRAHGTHEVEYRALLFHNGREVIRYSLYEDPDSRHGFTGRQSGSTYGLTLSEHFIVDSTAEAPAEIHIRYEGYVTVAGVGRTRFRGTLIILGTGKIRPGRPAFDDSEGRATFTAGSVTVGLW